MEHFRKNRCRDTLQFGIRQRRKRHRPGKDEIYWFRQLDPARFDTLIRPPVEPVSDKFPDGKGSDFSNHSLFRNNILHFLQRPKLLWFTLTYQESSDEFAGVPFR